jgi:hypothetical protein
LVIADQLGRYRERHPAPFGQPAGVVGVQLGEGVEA